MIKLIVSHIFAGLEDLKALVLPRKRRDAHLVEEKDPQIRWHEFLPPLEDNNAAVLRVELEPILRE